MKLIQNYFSTDVIEKNNLERSLDSEWYDNLHTDTAHVCVFLLLLSTILWLFKRY